jgi:hypothetical protein
MSGTVPPLIPLEAEYDECRTPKSPGLGLIHSPSTHLDPARPTAGQQRSKVCIPRDLGSFHRLIFYVTMVSGDGRPFSEHIAIAAPTALDKTSPLRHPPSSLPPLDPIKGQAGTLRRGGRKKKKNQSSSHLRRSTSQAISFVLLFFLSETWDRLPLSQLVTLYKHLGAKKYNTSPAGRRVFFCPNQDKPPCILLASPSRLGTHNTNSLVGLGPSRDRTLTLSLLLGKKRVISTVTLLGAYRCGSKVAR